MTNLITTGALLVLALGGGGEVPDVINDDSGPLWVAAEVASAEGRLSVASLGRFGEAVEQKAARAAERMAQSNTPGECSTFFGSIPDHFESTASLHDLVTNADEVITGRIVAARQGFHGGLPGTLLRLEATYLKGSPPAETYLFYPFARIPANGTLLCAKPLGTFVPPQPGDRLLIFSMGRGIDWEGRRILDVNTERELVHEPRTGVLQVPAALLPHAGEDRRFDDVLQAVMNRLTAQCATRVRQ